MKIAFLDDEPELFPNQYGGKARTILNLARTFREISEVESVSVLSRSIRAVEKEFIWEGIRFKKLEGYSIVGDIVREASSVDVLNVHTCSFTMPYLSGFNTAIVNHLHDVIFATVDAGSHLDKALGNNWSSIIAPSHFAKNTLLNIGWWSNLDSRTHLVQRGIDKSTFYGVGRDQSLDAISKNKPDLARRISQSWPIIFFPHRAEAAKGDEFLEGLHDLLATKYKDPLVLVTSDQKGTQPEGIEYIGWVHTDALKFYYSLSDVTVVLSKLPESFSQVPLESIACNTPVVAFRFGNLGNLIDEVPAIKGAYPNSKNIYDVVQAILEDETTRSGDLVDSESLLDEKYNPKVVANKLLDIYKSTPRNFETPSPYLSEHLLDQKRRYFASPLIAVYDHDLFFVNNDGKIEMDRLDDIDHTIFRLCQKTRTEGEVHRFFKDSNLKQVKYRLDQLVEKKILVRV